MNEHIGAGIKAIFLDFDDTLVAAIGPKWAHHKHVAKEYFGKELTDEELRKHWGKPLDEFMRSIYGDERVVQAYGYAYACQDNFPKELLPGVVSTLQRVKATGRFAGIITSSNSVSLEHNLQLHEVPKDLIDYRQTEEDTVYHKPDPRVFDPAIVWLAAHSIDPDEATFIGDGLQDMHAAMGAGLHFIGVETGLVGAKQFRAAGALSIPSIGALKIADCIAPPG